MNKYLLALILTASLPLTAEAANDRYEKTVFVANKAKYNPATVDAKLINAWGIATRPAGKGGHFWITGHDTSFQYVGDVKNAADEKLRTLHIDDLPYVKLPIGTDDNFATSVVFIDSKDDFTITQNIENADPITAPAKFIFASDGGIISAWTERKKSDGSFDRAPDAMTVIDESNTGASFFGLAVNANYTRLYAADFGQTPGIKVYDGTFAALPLQFDMPFDENNNKQVDAGEYAPFNIQHLKIASGQTHLFVAYAKTQPCPEEEIAKGTCEKDALFVGEEDTSKPGYGRIAEFNEDGKLLATWKDEGHLSAPWGMAFAPSDFGAYSNALLVANFGSGEIAAFDPDSKKFMGTLKDHKGKTIEIDKIWGLVFGNGQSLGDTNALYFTAGPEDETDGIFGSLRPASE